MIASEALRRLAHERELRCAAVVFNLDGILIARAQSEQHWRVSVMRRCWPRGVDTFGPLAPVAEREDGLVNDAQAYDSCGAHALPGARGFLKRLPKDRWGIVTAAPRALAQSRLRAARLPEPQTLVSGEDVDAGMPWSVGYLDAAQRLGVDADACVAFADAPARIMAAKAAGMTVVAVTTSAGLAGADYLVVDLRGIVIAETEPLLRLRIWDANAPSDGCAA
jgi:HAD superfamily hydrolase (TIGR01509 family)